MATTCQVAITMGTDTLTALVDSDYWLYGFTSVQCADAAGLPLVWMRTQAYSQSTVVEWSPLYQAYTAAAAPTAGGVVAAGFSVPITPGQTLAVTQRTGVGSVTADGQGGAVGVLNRTTAPLQCGIAQASAGAVVPVCTFPLYGGALQTITPLPTVLLLFSPEPLAQGTPVTTAPGPGVLLDLGGATRRAVSFDVNLGWDWGGGTWGWPVPAGSEMAPYLVQRPATSDAGAGGAPADFGAAVG